MSKSKNATLWVIQILLTLLFIFSGGSKLVLPADFLAAQVPLPVMFVRFIGILEILGALGLFIPAIFKMKSFWTPLAAWCLVVLMVCATVVTIATMGIMPAILPVVTGILCAVVACGRRSA